MKCVLGLAIVLVVSSATRLMSQAPEADPLAEKRRTVELEIASELAKVARSYVARDLPRCAVELFRDARSLDSKLEDELRVAEGRAKAESDTDERLRKLHRDSFNPWPSVMIPAILRRDKRGPRDEAAEIDVSFHSVVSVRERSARRLVELAGEFAGERRWREAFAIVQTALEIEVETTLVDSGKLVSTYRKSHAEASAEQRTRLLKGAKKKGKWKKVGASGLGSPPFSKRVAYVLSKEKLVAPFRVEVDVRIEQQPGGSGVVVLAQDSKNYVTVELNSQGMGYSLYVARVVKGKREVIGGAGTIGTNKDRRPLPGRADRLYFTSRLARSLLVIVEVEDTGTLIVSTLLGELFRTKLPADCPRSGSYGLVHVPYVNPKKWRTEYRASFANILVGEPWGTSK